MKTNINREVQDEWADRFSKDLRTLDDTAFPLTCTACGTQFDNARMFLATTTAAFGNEGLTETYGGDGSRVLDIGRNCTCGRMVVQRFMSRRNYSTEGSMFRNVFGEKMKEMQHHGARKSAAHDALLNLLHARGKEAVMTL